MFQSLSSRPASHLLAGNKDMGWDEVDPCTFVARTRVQQTIEISLERLAEPSRHWYSTRGLGARPVKDVEFGHALLNSMYGARFGAS